MILIVTDDQVYFYRVKIATDFKIQMDNSIES